MNPPGFTGAGLDRADRLRLDPERLSALASSPQARLLRMRGLDPLPGGDGRLAWESCGGGEAAELIFLGLDGDAPVFAPLARLDGPRPNPRAVFALLETMPPDEVALWGTARSLIEWHNRHLFCGACGSATRPFRGGWGRKCEGCGADHFPRVDPVVIMLAEHGGRVLVGRQPQYPPRRYSALAGFLEPGESVEEAVARELHEEAGVTATSVRYVVSQPWPFPGSLMLACIAPVEDDALTLDRTELDDAFWVDRAGVEAALAGLAEAPFKAPPPFAIAHTLFERWLAGG
ncbi:MAG TPA: NAD(+) diphosphatase [Allosphingosinicella sp.]|jgi:NAD+ diphosphatase|nr:NAD(+) diphosphatase [Allosphingosinicella sp.]